MSLRVFAPLFASLVLFGCSDSTSNNSTSSSSGEMPIPPPTKVVWKATSMNGAPTARYQHTAVWTGSKMIVWGGNTGAPPFATNTGGLYDPVTDTWTPTSMTNAPAARFFHVAVWAGSKMLVWGGFGESALEPAGGLYDPATDTWTPMSTTNQPTPRKEARAIWTGKKLIVWDGGSKPDATGGLYDPATDKWEVVNQAGKPAPRAQHGLAWSGKVMMVWGGYNFVDWLGSGALFDPEGAPSGVWTTSTPSMGAPDVRQNSSLEFVHSVFIVWGGWNGGAPLDTGAMFDPTTNKWTADTSAMGVPAARLKHVTIAAGEHMLVWGGCKESLCTAADVLADGGQFVPDSKGGTWYPIEKQDALVGRHSSTAVYTGDGVIVWGGGLDDQTFTNTGAFAPL